MEEKKIRGVPATEYAKLRHKVESGQATEEDMISKGLLKPPSKATKGLATNLDEKIFKRKDTTKGKEGRPNECRVPDCSAIQSRRGLCNTHRVYASRLIKSGAANEQNLINRGLMLPKNNPPTLKAASKPRNKQLPTKKVKTNKCAHPDCGQLGTKRGLCRKHYMQYSRNRNKLRASERELLDKDLIRRKLLLPEKPAIFDPFTLGSKIRGKR